MSNMPENVADGEFSFTYTESLYINGLRVLANLC